MTHSVLIAGTSSVGSLESSYARAFKRLGWQVHFWEPMQALHRVARGDRLGHLFSTFVHVEPWLRKANVELLQLADELRPQLLLIIGTEGVRAGTLAQIKVRAPDILIYCLYPDSPHNLDSDRINCLPFFDRVTTSSPAWMKAFTKLGAGRVHYLPFAADTELHRPASGNFSASPFAHDITFIGTWRAERESFLERLTDFDLCVWGSDYWKRRTRPGSPLRARWGGKSITGEMFAEVCTASKILLNIMDAATWPGPNMRTFEQPACRAFSLVTRTPAVLELFKEGETIECFETTKEAREKIAFYLKHDTERRRIAEASYRFVTEAGHTYMERVRKLIAWVTEDDAGAVSN
ncbi:MAG: glycosyltransferase [Pyrinomonadaceae bacterium]|nr:glycosyltransferase [Pyrinomonadaceae bacterium]